MNLGSKDMTTAADIIFNDGKRGGGGGGSMSVVSKVL